MFTEFYRHAEEQGKRKKENGPLVPVVPKMDRGRRRGAGARMHGGAGPISAEGPIDVTSQIDDI